MARRIQVTFDARDPAALGRFWCAALGYVEAPPPDGFASWDAALDAWDVPADQRDTAYAAIDPDGAGPRLYFQKVRLTGLGAVVVRELALNGEFWIVLQDPEGNELCLQ
ncbi:VOC family protein [Cellulosimicrobium terreum]|nr:VOC family protein [Cellulosimicrobium terreum]